MEAEEEEEEEEEEAEEEEEDESLRQKTSRRPCWRTESSARLEGILYFPSMPFHSDSISSTASILDPLIMERNDDEFMFDNFFSLSSPDPSEVLLLDVNVEFDGVSEVEYDPSPLWRYLYWGKLFLGD